MLTLCSASYNLQYRTSEFRGVVNVVEILPAELRVRLRCIRYSKLQLQLVQVLEAKKRANGPSKALEKRRLVLRTKLEAISVDDYTSNEMADVGSYKLLERLYA